MAPKDGELVRKTDGESPVRIEHNYLDETLPPCRECERHFFARNGTFNVFDAAIVLISMFTFAADIVTDGLAVSQYFVYGEPGWGCLTLSFTLVPCIIMQVFSIRWYLADEDMTGWRWIFHWCLLGPLERYVTVFETGLEARRSKDPIDFERLHHQQSDVCMLRLFESFLESAPQVVLQLYIMVATNDENLFTGISGTVSLFSLCWAVVAYSRAHRRVRTDKNGVSWPGVILQTIWRIGMISSRVVALVLFASAFKAYTFLVVGTHWLAMVLWVYFQHTDFCDTWMEERLFNGVIGTIYVFCFFNLKEGNTRYRISIFYLIIAVENVVLLLLWHRFGMLDDWYTSLGFTVVFGGFIVGVATMILYYRFFHPKGAIIFWSTEKNDVCLHGKSNHLSTLGRHGDCDAEIFHRSRTPSPQNSPMDVKSSPVENPCSDRVVTPCKYSPRPDPGSFDWRTPPSLRSKSLGCLFTSENECDSDVLKKGNAKSLEMLGGSNQISKPVHSQNSLCSCSFQMYELSGFATDLVDRFDKRKEAVITQSLLADESRMSLYSTRSVATKYRTPCRACLEFENNRASQIKSSQSRGRSYSQPNTPSVAKEHKSAEFEVRTNPQIKVRFASTTKAPNVAICQNAVTPGFKQETLGISQVSVDLPQMPDYIDSPEAADAMSAYEVQKIYDLILEREPLPRLSKRRLKFDEGGASDGCKVNVIKSHSVDMHTATPELVDKVAAPRSDTKIKCEQFLNPTPKLSSRTNTLEQKPHQNKQYPLATPGCNESESFCFKPKEAQKADDRVRSQTKTVETTEYFSSESVNSDYSNPDHKHAGRQIKPLIHATCTNIISREVSKHKTIHTDSDDKITNKVQAHSQGPFIRPMFSKTEQDKNEAVPTPMQSMQTKVCVSSDATSRKPQSGSLRVAAISHNIQEDRNVANDPKHPINTDPLPSHHILIAPSLSHVKPLEVLKDRNLDEIANRDIESHFRVESKVKCTPASSQEIFGPNSKNGGSRNSLNPPSTPEAKTVLCTMNDKVDNESKEIEHPLKKTQSKLLMKLETPKHPLNIANSPHSPSSKSFQISYGEKEPIESQGTPTTPSNSSIKLTPGLGKENNPLTPLSARLAMLRPSPNPSSPTQKKPPRKSLGRIPSNLVSNNVALFDN